MNTALKLQRTTGTRGQIYISDQAIAAVVRGALGEVNGIYGLTPPSHEGGMLGVLSKSGRQHSDIHISSDEGGALHVRLNLVIDYGLKLDEVARQSIEMVRNRVRTLAGVEVAKIEVEIKGLHHAKRPRTAA